MYSEEIKKNCNAILTGLKGHKMLDIIQSVEGQLSDGMWENSPRMEGYWLFECCGLVNDEVVIYISKQWGDLRFSRYKQNLFNGLTEAEIKKWFAQKIKQIIKQEIKDWPNSKLEWKRDCELESDYMHSGITVKDCYEAYDILLGRK